MVARGLFDRAVLRVLRHRTRAEHVEACVRHGEASRNQAAEAARMKRAEIESRVQPLPKFMKEIAHFSGVLLREGRAQLMPRLPAVAGLLVGWWIAQTFTDSELSATLHSWGFGDGPRHAVRGDTLRAMSFWLPLFAAALCSYAGSRLGALIRARYASHTDPG